MTLYTKRLTWNPLWYQHTHTHSELWAGVRSLCPGCTVPPTDWGLANAHLPPPTQRTPFCLSCSRAAALWNKDTKSLWALPREGFDFFILCFCNRWGQITSGAPCFYVFVLHKRKESYLQLLKDNYSYVDKLYPAHVMANTWGSKWKCTKIGIEKSIFAVNRVRVLEFDVIFQLESRY